MDSGGVFLHLADKAAFIDRVDFSIWGKWRRHPKPPIQVLRNIPIGGEGRMYARSIHAFCASGGNPVELKYGRIRPFPSIPPLRLILRSERTPLTAAQVIIAQDSFVRRGFRSYLSSIELTSDIHGERLLNIRHRLPASNRSIRLFKDESGRETLYFGLPTSSWQLRVYEKTAAIVRVEFVLRLPFLRSHKIYQPLDVLRLSKLQLWKKILPPCDERSLLRTMHRHLIW
jgi:hypothetical protein